MKIISLGCCCETTYIIDKFLGGSHRYPFDWLSIHDSNAVTEALEKNFSNFTVNNKTPVFWTSVHNNKKLFFSQIGNYNMHAVHKLTQETLNRRVKRFKKTMKENNKHILFIIKTHITDFSSIHPYSPYITKESTIRLCKALQQHTLQNATLLVVNEVENITHVKTVKIGNITVITRSIVGRPTVGSEKGSILVPCDFSGTKYITQWKNILEETMRGLRMYTV